MPFHPGGHKPRTDETPQRASDRRWFQLGTGFVGVVLVFLGALNLDQPFHAVAGINWLHQPAYRTDAIAGGVVFLFCAVAPWLISSRKSKPKG
jgi:hypothetical protein